MSQELIEAVENSDFNKVREILLNNKDLVNCRVGNIKLTPLHYAAHKGDIEMMQLLIGAGANVNAVDINAQSILSLASLMNKTKAVKLLLNYNADPNIVDNEGTSALAWAAMNNNLDMVNMLLGKKAEFNVVSDDGNTLLHFAGMLLKDNYDWKVVKKLIDLKLDPHAKNEFNQSVFDVFYDHDDSTYAEKYFEMLESMKAYDSEGSSYE